MQAVDQRTIASYGISGFTLMERAGAALFDVMEHHLKTAGIARPRIVGYAGRGNNGGDVFALARMVAERGYEIEVLLAGARAQIRGDAARHLALLSDAVPVHEYASEADWQALPSPDPQVNVVVDGLLGIGAQGAPRDAIAAAIAHCVAQARYAWVLSVDIPSGVNADTGVVEGVAVRADCTVTMGLPKQGLLMESAIDYVGRIEVADIGFPAACIEAAEGNPDRVMIHASDLALTWPRRPRKVHKYQCGHVLVIAGSRSYPGAALLATRAALRGGAGMVTACVPERVAPLVVAHTPECVVHAACETGEGSISCDAWEWCKGRLEDVDVVVIGPGLTTHSDTKVLVQSFLREARVPIVLDADALNVLGDDSGSWWESETNVIATPHAGEFARMTGEPVSVIESDRVGSARAWSDRTGHILVLKGAQTVVSAPKEPARICAAGNPGMATAGMGDVLAGLIGACCAQGLSPLNAAAAAVYVHATTADTVAARDRQNTLCASDVVDHLADGFKPFTAR